MKRPINRLINISDGALLMSFWCDLSRMGNPSRRVSDELGSILYSRTDVADGHASVFLNGRRLLVSLSAARQLIMAMDTSVSVRDGLGMTPKSWGRAEIAENPPMKRHEGGTKLAFEDDANEGSEDTPFSSPQWTGGRTQPPFR